MAFIDYYGLLQLSKDATPVQIRTAFSDYLTQNPNDERRDTFLEAYMTLRNRYRRARYDATYGYLAMIQPQPEYYPNAITYRLIGNDHHLALKRIIDRFKAMIVSDYELTWSEAQQANFDYQLAAHIDDPHLLLHFPQEAELHKFMTKLLEGNVVSQN